MMPRRFLSVLSALLLCLTCFGASLSVVSAGPNTVSPQPLPAGAVRAVVTRRAAMRTAPSRSAPIMRYVETGLSIAIFGSQNGFYSMQLRNGRQGWVLVDAVQLTGPLPNNSFDVH